MSTSIVELLFCPRGNRP